MGGKEYTEKVSDGRVARYALTLRIFSISPSNHSFSFALMSCDILICARVTAEG